MEMLLVRVHVALSSGVYVPADTEMVYWANLDKAGQEALLAELNTGLEPAVANALDV